MLDKLPDTGQLSAFVALVIPGIVILAIRGRTIRGSLPPLKDQIATYAVVAVLYLAIATPVFHSPRGLAFRAGSGIPFSRSERLPRSVSGSPTPTNGA